MAEPRSGVGLTATKALRYGTRRLQAEEGFSANKRDARLLVAIGKARYATADARPVREPEDETPALRQAYQAKFGKKPFGGWDADKLRSKLAEA